MCGIFGAIDTKRIVIDKNIYPHRGPDSWDVYHHECEAVHVTLFQSRLSIIGLGDQGKQPFTKDGKTVLIFNGEIYNYKQLREDLVSEHNRTFVTETDTEVLYECYRVYGLEKTLSKLNGIFSFAVYDTGIRKLFIARDHLGVKPLYYCHQGEALYFGSEAKAFFELKLLSPVLRKELLGEYFANGWIYEPDTLFREIYKIEAGNFAVYDMAEKSFRRQPYWSIQDKPAHVPSLVETIKCQTVADVPVGVYFSGGIDSSIISCALHTHDILNLHMNLGGNESEMVSKYESRLGLRIDRFHFDGASIDVYKKMVYYMDEPVADPAIIPSYILAAESRKKKRIVMLSGMGGDEIDGGYSRNTILLYGHLLKLLALFPHGFILRLLKGKLKRDYTRLINFAKSVTPQNYFSLTSYFSKKEIDRLVRCDWYTPYTGKIARITASFEGIKKYFALDFKGFLTSHNLLYIDKASMAASVEVRVPLLDKNIAAAFFAGLGKKKNAGKRRLKTVLRSLAGNDLINREKQGFTYPVGQWITSCIDWEEIIGYFAETDLIDTQSIRNWLQCEPCNRIVSEMKLWCVYTLYLWLSAFNVNVNNTPE